MQVRLTAIADDIDHVAIKPDNAPYFTPLSRTANSSLPVGVGFHVNYLFFISYRSADYYCFVIPRTYL